MISFLVGILGASEAEARGIAAQKPKGSAYGTEFRPLPRHLWRPFSDAGEDGLGPCACVYCSPDRVSRPVGAWDTLAVNGEKVWVCHGPEFRGVRRKRKGDK